MAKTQAAKGEQTMEREFDSFGYVKTNILKGYIKNLMSGKDTKEFSFEMKAYLANQAVFYYLNKIGALKIVNVETNESFDETGKITKIYTVKIKDFDIDCKALSKKTNKEFRVFDDISLGRAFRYANA